MTAAPARLEDELENAALLDVFSALGDPARWRMLALVAAQDGLGAAALQDALSLSKTMVSYHARILVQAGLLDARKSSRTVAYSLRPGTLTALQRALSRCSVT